MLHTFLTDNRQDLIARCRAKVARRFGPTEIPEAVDQGIPLFLQQLVDTLRIEQTTVLRDSAGPGPAPAASAIGRSAALHGTELLRLGYSVDQVVHDYGDVCQSVTELAGEQDVTISTDEFRTLNRCLDNAMADAVAAFGRGRQHLLDNPSLTLQARTEVFLEEHHRLVAIASQAFSVIKTGNVGLNGPTASLLVLSLGELRSLAGRVLPEIAVEDATAPRT